MMRRPLLCLVICALWPRAADAQLPPPARAPRWAADFSIASANVLVSGVTAGVTQRLRGGSFRDGFSRGALGGLVIFAGKRINAEDFYGAGFIGRQINGVGASIVWNAGAGLPAFERIVLPVGFTRVYWQRGAAADVQVRIDVSTVAWIMAGIIEPELHFDASRSLSFGMPVFRTNNRVIDTSTDGEHKVGGLMHAGVVFLSHVPRFGQDRIKQTEAHERVHTLQIDQLFLTLNADYDDLLLRRLPAGGSMSRWIDLNVMTEVMALVNKAIDRHGDRPWELEAIHLAR